jgi:hypothetical protein
MQQATSMVLWLGLGGDHALLLMRLLLLLLHVCVADDLENRLAAVDVIKESSAARAAAQRPAQRQVIRTGIYQKGSDDEDSDFE